MCAAANGLARHVTTTWLSRFLNEGPLVAQAAVSSARFAAMSDEQLAAVLALDGTNRLGPCIHPKVRVIEESLAVFNLSGADEGAGAAAARRDGGGSGAGASRFPATLHIKHHIIRTRCI